MKVETRHLVSYLCCLSSLNQLFTPVFRSTFSKMQGFNPAMPWLGVFCFPIIRILYFNDSAKLRKMNHVSKQPITPSSNKLNYFSNRAFLVFIMSFWFLKLALNFEILFTFCFVFLLDWGVKIKRQQLFIFECIFYRYQKFIYFTIIQIIQNKDKSAFRIVIAEIERTIDIIITCGVGRNRKKNILEKFKVKIFAVHTTRSI